MKEIKCSYCGKKLFDTEKTNNGSIGSEAMRLGYVFKIPAFYGISGCYFFCNKECSSKWSKENISPESKNKGDMIIKDLEEKKPEIVNELSEKLDKFSELLQKKRKQ